MLWELLQPTSVHWMTPPLNVCWIKSKKRSAGCHGPLQVSQASISVALNISTWIVELWMPKLFRTSFWAAWRTADWSVSGSVNVTVTYEVTEMCSGNAGWFVFVWRQYKVASQKVTKGGTSPISFFFFLVECYAVLDTEFSILSATRKYKMPVI